MLCMACMEFYPITICYNCALSFSGSLDVLDSTQYCQFSGETTSKQSRITHVSMTPNVLKTQSSHQLMRT